jgi:uncharacterized protein YjbI with pentapeptide repeats
MARSSINYRVSIINEKYSTADGRTYDSYAIVEKWIKRSKLSSHKYGIPTEEQLYSLIENEAILNISNCYLKDFSINNYRKEKNLAENAIIKLKSINAEDSFFESETETNFSNTQFVGSGANFKNCVFNLGKINFEHSICETELDFSNSSFFAEELNFRFSVFDHGDINFSNSFIDCLDLIFVNTNFGEGDVYFKQCDFQDTNCNFQYAQFSDGNVTFDRSFFYGKTIDFRKIEFGIGKFDFRRVHFGDGNLNFSDSEFQEAKISFRSSVFGKGEKLFEKVLFGKGNISFDGSSFGTGLLSLKGSSFNSISFVNTRLDGHCDFKVYKGNLIDLSHSIFKDILDFQSGEKIVDIKRLRLIGVKNMGKIFISWKNNNTYKLIHSQKNSSFEAKAEQFNLLKESFRANGKYESEDLAYVEFKRNELKAKLFQNKKSGGIKFISGYFNYYSQNLVFDKIGLFATSPLRVFFSMLIVLSLFSLLYMILPSFVHAEIISSVGDPDNLNLFERSFYHSAITFFTIGYGDFYPSGHVRWLSAVEGWAGVFLMSYFTVAFVRKILR